MEIGIVNDKGVCSLVNKIDNEYKIIYEKLKEKLVEKEDNEDSLKKRFKSIELQVLDARKNIGFDLYTPIYSHRKAIGKLLVKWKQFVRRSVAWFIGPLFYEQTVKNSRFGQIVFDISDVVKQIEMQNQNYHKEIDDRINIIQKGLTDRILNSNKEIDQMHVTLDRLGHTIENLRESTNTHTDKRPVDFKQSYAESGEDIIVQNLFNKLKIDLSGVNYLDIGGIHCKGYNNTLLFYKYGAKGVIIEDDPMVARMFGLERPRDVIIQKSARQDSAAAINCEPNLMQTEKAITVDSLLLNDIIKMYMFITPDLVVADLNGKELDVLKTIDFKLYRPKVFIVKTVFDKNHFSPSAKDETMIAFMQSYSYFEYCFTGLNSVFMDKNLANNLE
jgi:hypothetical protein